MNRQGYVLSGLIAISLTLSGISLYWGHQLKVRENRFWELQDKFNFEVVAYQKRLKADWDRETQVILLPPELKFKNRELRLGK